MAFFPPLDKRNTCDQAKGLCVTSERHIVGLGMRGLSTRNREQNSRQQAPIGSPADPYRFISPSHTGANLPLQGWAINAFGSSTLRWVKEPNDSYGEEGRSPKDYSSSLVRGTEGVAGFAADSWASR